MKTLTVITSLLFLSAFAHAEIEINEGLPVTTLNLASTDWCPYICADEDHPGFIVEFMRELLAEKGIRLEVKVLPWSRAIKMARQLHYDGLLTAIRSEAPDFHFTSEPTGHYQVCFYTESSSNFQYKNRESLAGLSIGGIQDYGYGYPIDAVIENPRDNENVQLISSSSPLRSLIGMLERRRIHTFVEDSAVLDNFINNIPGDPDIKQAGCLPKVPYYTALSPSLINAKPWITSLNHFLGSEKAATLYQQAAMRYGVNQ